MSEKVERKFTRLELADYLLRLSQELRAGSLEVEGRMVAVPEELGAEIHLKEKHGLTITKLSWGWPTAGTPGTARSPAETRQPLSFGAVKKRLGAIFGQLHRSAGQGQFPGQATLEEFFAVSRDFAALTAPEWAEPMRAYLEQVANLQQAAAAGQVDAALREIKNLHQSMTTCHQAFK